MIVLQSTQEQVLAALQAVAGVVERRHTLPVLANVLIRKRGTLIEFTASDLECQLRTRAELGGESGSFDTTVHAGKLIDILRALPAAQGVTLKAQGNRLSLHGGRSRFTLQTLPAEGFPLVADAVDLGPSFGVAEPVLQGLIDQVEFAMAVHDIRYYLNGVLFVAEGRRLRLVATDGNRLALAETLVDAELPQQEVILPRKAVLQLQRLLRGTARGGDAAAAPVVSMRFSAAQARFEFNGIEFVTRLVDGRFPDFNRVIPKDHRHALTVARAPLLAALLRASILTSEKFKGIRLTFEPGSLRIASSNAEQEEADEDLEVDYGGERVEIGFNVSYLVDLLSRSDAEQVQMALRDAASTVRFSFPQRAGFQYVVSPMRL
jgi:DNA polymerase-3 subunit beta